MGMLETIGVVKEGADGKEITVAAKEGLLIATRSKLEHVDVIIDLIPGLIRIPTGVTNLLASDSFANRFYDPSKETFSENAERNKGWHDTWIPAYEKPLVEIFDMDSMKILLNTPLVFVDPTEAVLTIIKTIESALEDVADLIGDVKEFIAGFADKIFAAGAALIKALTIDWPGDGVEGVIKVVKEIFEDASEEARDAISDAMDEKQDEIETAIIEMLAPIEIHFPTIPTLETLFEWLGIDIDLENLPSLIFPGIPGLAPPGFLIMFYKILQALVDLVTDVLTMSWGVLGIDYEKIIEFILGVDFIGLIRYLAESIIGGLIAKIKEFIPEFDKLFNTIATIIAYLQNIIAVLIVVIIGHLVGPGMIIENVAQLLGVI
jgi:hypothetical protein